MHRPLRIDYFAVATTLARAEGQRLTDDQRRAQNEEMYIDAVRTWFRKTDPPASGDGSAAKSCQDE